MTRHSKILHFNIVDSFAENTMPDFSFGAGEDYYPYYVPEDYGINSPDTDFGTSIPENPDFSVPTDTSATSVTGVL